MGYALPVIMIPIVSGRLLDAIGDDRSSRTLARVIQNAGAVDVVGVAAYPPSLPFYLRRTFPVATPAGRELTSNFIADHYEKYRAVPESPLKPVDYWRERLRACTTPTAFVTRSGDRPARAALDSVVPLLAVEERYVAYGPCAASSAQ
jgi:hypothetical protein